jgi:hypothetical protein
MVVVPQWIGVGWSVQRQLPTYCPPGRLRLLGNQGPGMHHQLPGSIHLQPAAASCKRRGTLPSAGRAD